VLKNLYRPFKEGFKISASLEFVGVVETMAVTGLEKLLLFTAKKTKLFCLMIFNVLATQTSEFVLFERG
jgi:hypothetical protein